MQILLRQTCGILIVLALWTSVVFTNEASTLRLVRASITLDGKTLLEGSIGDNGRVDADGVWEHLKSITFKATEDFRKLNIAPNAKEVILKSNAAPGQLDTIILDIMFGGKVFTRELKLIRVPIDENGREWALEDAQVDRLFDERLIRRSYAASLENPRNTKR